MRIISTVFTGSVTAITAALIGSLVGVAGSASAAQLSHSAAARADWKTGAPVAAAQESRYWIAARHQLAAYGHRYAHESADLTALINIPLTSTTAKQRATAARVTRELNGFFHIPGAAIDELDSYGTRFSSDRADLASLESIPLTNTTARQRAAAHRDVRALDSFFHAPGLKG